MANWQNFLPTFVCLHPTSYFESLPFCWQILKVDFKRYPNWQTWREWISQLCTSFNNNVQVYNVITQERLFHRFYSRLWTVVCQPDQYRTKTIHPSILVVKLEGKHVGTSAWCRGGLEGVHPQRVRPGRGRLLLGAEEELSVQHHSNRSVLMLASQ